MFLFDSPLASIAIYVIVGFALGFFLNISILLTITATIGVLAVLISSGGDNERLVYLMFIELIGSALVTMWTTAIGVRKDKIMSCVAGVVPRVMRKPN